MIDSTLINKYNVPGPRYTSYPTVPYWDIDGYTTSDWLSSVKKSFLESKENGISLYIHLPFCESLCTFCACNKRITKNHEVEEVYIKYLLKEWGLYLNEFPNKPTLRELHLGGGTPTFFSPKNLEWLLTEIFKSVEVHPEKEFSIEGHPNNTSKEHMETLFNLGFRRISFGVQDYDPLVQKAINRIQSFEKVKEVTEIARRIGYTSISHDLVFGLPFQKLKSIEQTIRLTCELKPERIAFYSYAHVPWIKGVGQRGFNEGDLPSGTEKRKLYEVGKMLFEQNGYIEIGMDHFALPQEDLYQSIEKQTLHRNFMGYTTTSTQLMIGLGVSAIGDSWYCFSQNEKKLEDYYSKLDAGEFPVFRGHVLNDEDLIIRRHILHIMCRMETSWGDDEIEEKDEIVERLQELQHDGLIEINAKGIKVTELGRSFLRNIAMAFDLRMLRKEPESRLFSMTI